LVSSQITFQTLSSKAQLTCSASSITHPSFATLLEFFHSSSMTSSASSPSSMWTTNFLLSVNTMLLYLRPAMTTLLQQKVTLDHIVKTLYKCLGTIAFPTGVAITHATLPNDRIEMTVFLPNPVDPKWHLKFHEALLPENSLDNPPQLTSLQFFHKDKSASLVYGDIHVNISINDIAALYNSAVYEDVDAVMSSDGLMKVSYLLIKSWIVNDSGLPGDHHPSLFPHPCRSSLPETVEWKSSSGDGVLPLLSIRTFGVPSIHRSALLLASLFHLRFRELQD
jgi:hypothetical protein